MLSFPIVPLDSDSISWPNSTRMLVVLVMEANPKISSLEPRARRGDLLLDRILRPQGLESDGGWFCGSAAGRSRAAALPLS